MYRLIQFQPQIRKSPSVKESTRLYYISFERLFEQLGDVGLMEPLRVKKGLSR